MGGSPHPQSLARVARDLTFFAGDNQFLGDVSFGGVVGRPFHVQDLLSLQASETTAVLATNLPGIQDVLGSRDTWRT